MLPVNARFCADLVTKIANDKDNGSLETHKFALLFEVRGKWFAHNQPDRAATSTVRPAGPNGASNRPTAGVWQIMGRHSDAFRHCGCPRGGLVSRHRQFDSPACLSRLILLRHPANGPPPDRRRSSRACDSQSRAPPRPEVNVLKRPPREFWLLMTTPMRQPVSVDCSVSQGMRSVSLTMGRLPYSKSADSVHK